MWVDAAAVELKVTANAMSCFTTVAASGLHARVPNSINNPAHAH